MQLGVNFFGLRDPLYRSFDSTLEWLKEAGFRYAEVCIAFGGNGEPPKELNLTLPPEALQAMTSAIWPLEQAAQRIKTVRAHGLTVDVVHAMLGFQTGPEELAAATPLLVEFGQANKIKCFVVSLMKDLDSIKPCIHALADLSDKLAEAGIVLAYHNHEMECVPQNGITALDILLEQCPNMQLELDVGWAKFAGADPVELMRKYRDRLPLLHLKDIRSDASPATRDTCCTAVGEGSIPLTEIIAASKDCLLFDCGLIVDQDASEVDILTDLKIGAAHIRSAAETGVNIK